ncbi:phosphoribosyltransferase family protein [Streptomyces rubellomurinus]|uniref:Phosphoribosyl transferase n=1 Tax=Streptomyces rubellomurinus (strain ATCC 31215) TaxID=359131 RepID=A0A0F2TJR6_STRR3|nr:phosphoribosyltransferase family protein [Streptomyces rubellomurinus]KJS62766.1 phosphoribosyl transferase [Streptomyces rubellomurinus]
MRFTDRTDAGRRLAARLAGLAGLGGPGTVVVALPRGGVPVAAEVAAALGAPLDLCVIRKLGVPYQPELGMGAIGEGGVRVLNESVMRVAGVTDGQLAEVERRERAELARRARRYRGDRPPVELRGRTVVVVDDGIATGSTARAACLIVRARGAARVVLAVPVAPGDWTDRLTGVADELVCVGTPSPFFAIGEFYDDFTQTEDEEVLRLLAAARHEHPPPAVADPPDSGPVERELLLPVAGVRLAGLLTVPDGARGVVVFAHGSGSSRHSPRNRYVARYLNRAGLATLLFDLLTEAEEADRRNVFDVGLLGGRLTDVARRLGGATPDGTGGADHGLTLLDGSGGADHSLTAHDGVDRRGAGDDGPPETRGLPLGLFGASTGAAAALHTAAALGPAVRAVVSRGGRPDLAGPDVLARVAAPTLLVVGSLDGTVLDLNRRARAGLRCDSELAVVPGASHLFEEPGTLDRAAELAGDWFLRHLPAGRAGQTPVAHSS